MIDEENTQSYIAPPASTNRSHIPYLCVCSPCLALFVIYVVHSSTASLGVQQKQLQPALRYICLLTPKLVKPFDRLETGTGDWIDD